MMKANREIRDKAKGAGCHLWEVAEMLGMSDSAFSRKLRRELQSEEKQKILTIIDLMVLEKQEVT